MPKRASTGDTDSRDSPEVIATRRKARVSGRFRQSAHTQAKPAAPVPSAFAGMGGTAPTTTPGFVFGAGGADQPSSNSFSLGAATVSTSSSSTFGPGPTAGGTTPPLVPGGGVRPIAAGGFSFQNNTPATSAALSKPPEKQLAPARPTTVNTQPIRSSAPQGAPSSTAVSSSGPGRVFGEGRTAARGGRLNKRFSSWVSYQLAEDAASFLDSGLRDYVAFAAEIRERVDFAKAEQVSATAFRHPSGSAVAASKPDTKPKPSETSTSTTGTSQASVTPPPPVVAAPPPAPSPVAKPAPEFSFHAASTLPAASSGRQFSFALPSAPASASVSGEQTTVAPAAPSPSRGFKFDAGGLGPVGASPSVFKGFQLPAGVAIPLPVAAGSLAAGAEDDGMPKEDPSKLERAPGEENEEIVGHFRVKLFRFKMDEKTWGDMGVGMLRLMKHTANDGRRLVLRNDMGKVILNAAVYKGMSVTKAKNTIKFVANVAGDGPTTFMVKVTAKQIDDLHTRVVGLVPSS